ncbi:hypothetical protein F5883DRAFT_124763 [Diaporthe sp. PMI_573]|nr:hypothetical protein F5883DRAFT_124763 [Diaporthaceae sp. PMI_573]
MGISTYGVYLAVPGEHVCKLLRGSRQLVPCPSLEDALKTFFGLPSTDLRIFDHQIITQFERSTAFRTDHSDPSRRIMAHQRRDFSLYFQGQHLEAAVWRFLSKLMTNFRKDPQPDICDIYMFLFGHIFHAEICALYDILQVIPKYGMQWVRRHANGELVPRGRIFVSKFLLDITSGII